MQLAPADPRAISEAEPLAREALGGCREVLGNGHPETLKSVCMLATLLTEAGMHAPNKDYNAIIKAKLNETIKSEIRIKAYQFNKSGNMPLFDEMITYFL